MQKIFIFLMCAGTVIFSVPKDGDLMTVRVRGGAVMRAKPSVQAKIVSKVSFGDLVVFRKSDENVEELMGVRGAWYEIQNGNSSQIGWIFSPLLREDANSPVVTVQNGKITELTASVEETVFDKRTGIIWTSCNAGQTYKNGRCEGLSLRNESSDSGKSYCAGLRISGLQWQLPSLAELRTVANASFTVRFPYSEMGIYTSSTRKSSATEDYMMDISIPERTEASHGLDGNGMVKCFAKK